MRRTELTPETIADIRNTALGHCEETTRALRESWQYDLQDDERFELTEYYLSWGQVEALWIVIQQYLDGGSYSGSWWVGTGGSWGEQVLGLNPPTPSLLARKLANAALAPIYAAWQREFSTQVRCALAELRFELVFARMGIGSSPVSPTRPNSDDRRDAYAYPTP